MKNLKKCFLGVALATLALSACTSDVENGYMRTPVKLRTQNEAISIAENAYSAFNSGKGSRAGRATTVKASDVQVVKGRSSRGIVNDTLLYIVNYEDNGGFAVVSASTATEALVGIAEEGNYKPGEEFENPNFQFYLDKVCENLGNTMNQMPSFIDSNSLIPGGPYVPPCDSFQLTTTYTLLASKGPYVDLKWGQGYPYGSRFANGTCDNISPVVGMITATLWTPRWFYVRDIPEIVDWEKICQHKGNDEDCSESNPTAIHNQIADLMLAIHDRLHDYQDNNNIYYGTYLRGAFDITSHDNYIINPYELSDIDELKWYIDRYETDGLWKSLAYAVESSIPEYSENPLPEHILHCWLIDGYKVVRYNLRGSEPVTYMHCNWACDGNSNGYFLPSSYFSNEILSYDSANHSYTAQFDGTIKYYRAGIELIVGI